MEFIFETTNNQKVLTFCADSFLFGSIVLTIVDIVGIVVRIRKIK